MRGLFCVDPGGHTGVAWSIVDISSHDVKTAMQNRLNQGSTTIEGPEASQIRELYVCWIKFKRLCVKQFLLPEEVELVLEDFTLRPGQHAGGKDGTTPERIAWGFEGYRMGRADAYGPRAKHYAPIHWQSASAKSRYDKRPKLTEAAAWVVGREHERTAYAHMMLRLNTILR